VIVCFDPSPGGALRGRNRLRVPVLLDGRRALAPSSPAPASLHLRPRRARRIAIAQPGEVDWLAPATRARCAGSSPSRLGAGTRSGRGFTRRLKPGPQPPAGQREARRGRNRAGCVTTWWS